MRDTIYDIETYPNYFCLVAKHADIDSCGIFEISDRRNDLDALYRFTMSLERMVGFNNVGFDYVLLHHLLYGYVQDEFNGWTGGQIAYRMYELCQHIIESDRGERLVVWDNERLVPQLDLYKIHHFDNRARAIGLKALQFNMRSPSIEDIPIPPGTWLTYEQMDITAHYCVHDVYETGRFLELSREEIAFREELGPSWWNLSDTSIGKRFFRERLEQRNPGCTRGRTPRGEIELSRIILPWIQFRHEPFDRKLRELRSLTVHAANLKDAYSGSTVHRGFLFDFGAGGLHGSVKNRHITADDDHEVRDVDVTSYYPTLAIANNSYPAHLGPEFCLVYDELFKERQQHKKGSSPNKAIKLALNGVFGDSNNQFSKGFFDPAYTLAITINGQLELCMLAEAYMDLPGLEIIQANTDGLTIRFPRSISHLVDEVSEWWQWGTALRLESEQYADMFIRDVNNYTAKYVGGKIKRKGAYEYKLEWYKDHSGLCIPKAAEKVLYEGYEAREVLAESDPWDFMMRAKVPRNSRLLWGQQKVQRISRYYLATEGAPLTKLMPGIRGNSEPRHISVQKGRTVQLRNRFDGERPNDLDLDWYVKEVEKITKRFR